MGRPTTLTGWWKDVLDEKANGRIDVLADLFEVNVKTLNRWFTGEIQSIRDKKRKHCRMVLGKEFLPPKAGSKVGRKDCPRAFRNIKKV
jgi:hypothetical protein